MVNMGGTVEFEGCTTHGPWGGSQGNKWVYMPQGFTKKIKICVKYGEEVDSITFQTDCDEGEPQSSFFGGRGGDRLGTVCIDYPNERLMSINGVCCRYHSGLDVVSSLSFMTNLNLYGPYGSTCNGIAFSYDVQSGDVVAGFHGRPDKYLTAIGVYVIPTSLALRLNFPTYECEIKNESSSGMSRILGMARDAGPWGAVGGKPWDDGVFSTVKQVHVHLGELNVIYALRFVYLNSNDQFVWSEIHGGKDGFNLKFVNLDDKDEYLTGISGFYGPVEGYNGLEAIASISFHTNKRIYGPYGEERGAGHVYFSSSPSPGKVVGFHGRSNGFLSAIGVLMEYF